MYSLYGTIRTALVVLTALLTLVSSIPRFSCICPDGGTQTDLPVIFGWSGCRFVPADKHAVSAPPTKRSCCTSHSGAGTDPHTSTQLNSQGCRRSLSPTDVMAVSSAPTLDDHSSSIVPPLAWVDACLTFRPEASAWQSSSPNRTSPPPTDLVVRLLRYLV